MGEGVHLLVLPAGQSAHDVLSDEDILPEAQSWHELAFTTTLNLPNAHERQDVGHGGAVAFVYLPIAERWLPRVVTCRVEWCMPEVLHSPHDTHEPFTKYSPTSQKTVGPGVGSGVGNGLEVGSGLGIAVGVQVYTLGRVWGGIRQGAAG